ncbi:type I restriction-modification enzyme R subunit C-terminal domain-containing protein [Flavobacterium paronense]|uniref:DEAD/DEAH box helicase family protein n=1 Tax=Flavobacterium paronense TaxID=1392775 RepID=A0ABV5GCP0_9FLAO|nr:DEAD/DEAH box helicase family protein [Flavobacterium paronense]MDN3676282.1 type I restriction-modification enzyme R subunit C-terminal domain-containing protein [Flavobacterium paronense]
MTNQNPEQIARDNIDKQLLACGWVIQDKKQFNLAAGLGIAIREYQTDVGPADYVLFVDKKPVGIIEAKREEEGVRLTTVEDQSSQYANAKLRLLNNDPLPFVYESTGEITRFTDYRDLKPRSRNVFTFHRPETFVHWLSQSKTLRTRLHDIPHLPEEGLRDCQITAINNLEKSFKDQRPKALIQMATGSGKTFTAITAVYRLLKYAKAKRILFLVDTKNLGEQAEGEFRAYTAQEDNRLFTELYGVTRLNSSFIPNDSQVYISTIQRMYSILKETELDESAEEENPNESRFIPKEPVPVGYNEKVPIEFFDFVVIDECHRSIYNLWKQVLDYFDVFQIGLTATPDNRTFGYFNQNLVSDYGYEKAVIDGVLVPYNVFTIETEITKNGASILKEFSPLIDRRSRQTRKKFWEALDEDEVYSGKQLDKDIVNPSTIRTIIKATKDNLPAMFPDRMDSNGVFEVPKLLIFAKTDSHAEDIIEIVREEFGEENKFCKKITYKSDEDPKSVLQQFRNDYYPRIAVTVDMIATGTDIRPLEVLLFMRDVKSRSYYEQMKGRGTRTCTVEELKAKGTPTAKFSKDHFVIIDAIGVEQSQKTDSRPLEKAPGISLKDVLQSIAIGNTSEEMLSTLASRLLRLDKQLNDKDKAQFAEKANGMTIPQVVKQLLQAHDPDVIESTKCEVQSTMKGMAPIEIEAAITKANQELIEQAVAVFHSPELRDFVVDIRKQYDQLMDMVNIDAVTNIGWVKDHAANSAAVIEDFKTWIVTHKDEITALQVFYAQDYRHRTFTYKMIKELCDTLKKEKPLLAPLAVWRAYEQLEKTNGSAKNELIALVSLIRKVAGIDTTLTAYDKTVDKNFQDWIFTKNAGKHNAFTEAQMQWLRMMKDYVANSFSIDKDDFDLSPFNAEGGLSKMWALFGDQTDSIIEELNEVLAA